MARQSWTLVVAGIVSLSTPLMGHHSFAEFYLEDDTIEVEGEILEVQYKNPHSWIHVQGEDPFRRPRIYSVEWASVSRLERDGISKRTRAKEIGFAFGHRLTAIRTTIVSASSESSDGPTTGRGARLVKHDRRVWEESCDSWRAS